MNVAWKKGHKLTYIVHQKGDIENHVMGIAVLKGFTIDRQP